MKASSTTSELLTRNVEDVIVRTDLEKKLRGSRKLRVKLGIDPTGPLIHLGYATVLWKLRDFQLLGHKIVLIIGDFTAQIGDTSDKTSQRPMLTAAEVKSNQKTYLNHIGKILDLNKTEVHHNSEWFGKIDLREFIQLASSFTIQQMIERENFANRIKANKPVGLHETLYPVLQGYDSIKVKADVEIGGTDQLFNILAGRKIQQQFDQVPQNVLTLPLLIGTDGRKMSKSWDNCIYITDKPIDMYGKVMALRDEFIPSYFKMATDMPMPQIEQIEADMARGDNPRDTKAGLARRIVARYYDEPTSLAAEAAWNKQFRERQTPADVAVIQESSRKIPILLDILNDHFVLSRSEARRILEQGGVRVDGRVVQTADFNGFHNGSIIQLGKRRLVKLSLK